jgi:hypothetical protein
VTAADGTETVEPAAPSGLTLGSIWLGTVVVWLVVGVEETGIVVVGVETVWADLGAGVIRATKR